MTPFLIALASAIAFLIAYRTYGRWLGQKIFRLSAERVCPSVQFRDDVDYCPSNAPVIFGHHFTSIAGTGPIVGPAIAIMWGWLPALLWVVLGSIFIGAVHDLGSLVVSLRNNGQTVGDIAGRMLNRRVRLLFLFVLFLAITIVLAIFGLVIAAVFRMFPAAMLPCLLQRYVVQELAGTLGERGPVAWMLTPLRNKHGATLYACAFALIIAMIPPAGKPFDWASAGTGGLLLWPLFGATNQLLGGLAFLVITFYLLRRGLPVYFTVIPMVFMLVMPVWAMGIEIFQGYGGKPGWIAQGNWLLAGMGLASILPEVWMVTEAILLIPRVKGVLEGEAPVPAHARTIMKLSAECGVRSAESIRASARKESL